MPAVGELREGHRTGEGMDRSARGMPMNLMPFDLTKWRAGEHDGVYTWDGRKVVRLEEWPELTSYKLIGLVEGDDMTDPLSWMPSGSYFAYGQVSGLDLMLRVPEPKKVERWAVLKPNGDGIGWESESGARSWLPQGYSIAHIIYDPATGKGTIERVEP